MTRWLKEPLVQFLLIGVAIFGLNAVLMDRDERTGDHEIRVTQGRIQSLIETFRRQWSRPPSQDELNGLVNDFVREEALMREAMALGLDHDDVIVRRRLAQKMEFLAEDAASVMEPTDLDLRTYLVEHPQVFFVSPRYTFNQIALDPAEQDSASARKLALALNAGRVDPQQKNAIRMLDVHQEDVSAKDVTAQFGTEFTARLEELPLGRWEGPITSGYGMHLVRVEMRVPGSAPRFEEVRDEVAAEWSAAKRQEMQAAQVRELLARYTVTIEAPESGDGETADVKR